MYLPSSGTILGDMSRAVEPHKLGNVMWTRTALGCMVPYDLHYRIPVEDERALDKIYFRLKTFRKVTPALEVVKAHMWSEIKIIKPYLIETMKSRSEARSMMIIGDWDWFWSSL